MKNHLKINNCDDEKVVFTLSVFGKIPKKPNANEKSPSISRKNLNNRPIDGLLVEKRLHHLTFR